MLVGDVEPEQVFALVEKYYGAIPRGPATPPVRTVEPEQTGERRLVIERSGQNPLVQMAWHAISADDPRAPALNLLQTILTEGDAARLHRVLVEERKLAVEVGSGWSEGFDPNLYSVYATLAEGASTVELEQALNGELGAADRHGRDGRGTGSAPSARSQPRSGAASRPSTARRACWANTRCCTAITASCSPRRRPTSA